MKKDIQPKVNMETVVTCACGNKFTTISTLPTINVEICSECHPFYTGQRRFVDTERRIDKFTKKVQLAEEKKKQNLEMKKAKEEKKKAKSKVATPSKDKSVREILDQIKEEEASK